VAVLIDSPAVSLLVGRVGPLEAAFPLATGNWQVDFTKVLWPLSGQVLLVTIEESKNNGASWEFSASLDLTGGPWKDRTGATVLTSSWSTTPLYRDVNARIRITVDVAQVCTLGLTVSA
jgi:hypothetical protein